MVIKNALITFFSYIRRPDKRKLIRDSIGFSSLTGLEVGGPSVFFSLKGHFPVYVFAKDIDGVNYSNKTIWEGHIDEGRNFQWHDKTGYQYIKEATDLSGIPDNKYDFVLSSHSLEHTANPLKALLEWKRVLKKDGYLVLILPDKRYTFDRDRQYTSMEHLLLDYNNDTPEDDSTHFKETLEVLELDKSLDKTAKDKIAATVADNYNNRCVHHHVFSVQLIKEMLGWASFDVLYQKEIIPHHLFTMAQKRSL